MNDADIRYGQWTFLATLLAFAASFGAWHLAWLDDAGFFLVLGLCAWSYARSFLLGTTVVLVELVAGSFGHAFSVHGVSVREGLLAVACVATAARLVRSADDRSYCLRWGMPWAMGLVALALVWGAVRGFLLHPAAVVAADANAYGYFLLLPTTLLAFRGREDRDRLVAAIFGAATANAVLVLVLLVLFTHALPEDALRVVYKWVRDFGFGEITRAPGGFARVFLQSAFWNAVVYLWAASFSIAGDRRPKRWLWLAGALSAAVVFVSFSRTFWVSVGLAWLGVTVVDLVRFFANLRSWDRLPRETGIIGSRVSPFMLSLGWMMTLGVGLAFLLTQTVGGAALSRTGGFAGGAAVDSRMNLLEAMRPAIVVHPLLGTGFGTELTYRTLDPRLLAELPPDGMYTTSAFEWGWLDLWLKMGILGPLAFLALLGGLVWRGAREFGAVVQRWQKEAIGMVAGIVFLAFAHVFSPWINHPLGVGLILVTMGMLAGMRTHVHGTASGRA